MLPDGITIFGFKIYFYGILIMLGALVATWIAYVRAKQYGRDPDIAWDMLPWALVGGIIGARIWHILTPPASMQAQGITTMFYLTHPLEMLNLRNGGLGIPGAVLGGFIAVYFYARNRDESILTWADIIAPGLAIAQGIGRWGNFFNQELYGAPTDLPWKLYIDPSKRLREYANVDYYHPLFLYEFIWNLINAGVLIWASRRFKDQLKRGDIFCIYLIFYGVGRFALEFLRLDPSPVAGININQTLMAVIAVSALAIIVIRHRFARPGTDETLLPEPTDGSSLEAESEPADDRPSETLEEGKS